MILSFSSKLYNHDSWGFYPTKVAFLKMTFVSGYKYLSKGVLVKMTKQSNEINSDLEEECKKVEKFLEIDMISLLKRLEEIKGKKLSEREIQLLCLSFLGKEPTDIAEEEYLDYYKTKLRDKYSDLTEEELKKKTIDKNAGDIRSTISKTLRKYIKEIIKQENNENSEEKIEKSWLKIICWLRENGYKKHYRQEQSETELRKLTYLGNLKHKDTIKLLERIIKAGFRIVIKEIDQGNDEGDENDE